MFATKYLHSRALFMGVVLMPAFLALGISPVLAAPATTSTTMAITSGGTGTISVASGTVVTLTATVKAGTAAVQLGQVNFCDATAAHCTDIHLLGTVQLASVGTAELKFVPAPGSHSYKAEFAGTTSDAASASGASALTVTATSTTTIAQSGSVGNYTLKAAVSGKGVATAPTGTVSFRDASNGNAVLGTAKLLPGTAGALTWTNSQTPATEPEPQSIAVADFNSDGIPDIAVGTNGTAATSNVGYINLLLGNGDGTFQAAKTFTALADNQVIVAAPFVDGGSEDILTVSNSSTGANNALLFIGDGKGGFTAGTPFSLGGVYNVSALIVGDFNGDGKQDFVIAGEIYGVPVMDVFLGNGNGTFNGGTLNATADTSITALGAGDFTGSGALDLAVVGSDSSVQVFLQDGIGDFYPGVTTNAGKSPTAIVVGDFNGDGKADLAITNGGDDNVTILLGNGSGGFTAAARPATGQSPSSIALGDFNGDGKVDLAVANSGVNTVTVLLGKGDGTFMAGASQATGIDPHFIAGGNFNGNGMVDLAVANADPANTKTGTLTVLLSQMTQTSTATASGISPTSSGTHLVDASYPGDDNYEASVSGTTSLTGSTSQTTPPVFSPAVGTYASAQKITLTDATSGATIYYTTNGTPPTTASTKYTAAITISATETIEAIAVAAGYTNSMVTSAKYTIETPAATPTFSVAAGTYTSAQLVKLTDATAGAVIYYTTNGTTPTTASAKYTAAITVSATETIKAIAVATSFTNSAVASAAYTIKKPGATPVFSIAAGTYTSAQSVKLTDSTTGATIYYTTNGTTPTTASTKYTTAITVSATETIKAIAVATGYTNSAVASAAYVIETPTATPVISPAAGTYTSAKTVAITDTASGATIYYTTNGATPTTASTKYSAAFKISASATIKAVAVASGHTTSAVATAAYVIETPAATPAFSVAAGTYATTQTVKITDTTAGAVIYYTTNGATPTTASMKYTAAIAVSTTETVKAIAVTTGYINSAVASAAYTIEKPAATPAFSVVAGTYTSAQTVKITDTTAGAVIYYTTNGATPTTASTKYTTAITVAATETLEAIAVATAYTNSAVASAKYTIETSAATPAFSVAAGTYAAKQSVTITDATTGAAIYYTTNGTIPTTSSTKYTTAIPVSASETIEAVAVATGYTNSVVVSAKYTFVSPAATPTFSVPTGTYSAVQSVQILDATPGATIYYTTNGAAPTPASAVYKSAVSVSATEYLQAIAVANGYTTSPIATALYSIGADVTATPVLSPPPGAYGKSQTVTITDATAGAVITYSVGIGSTVNTYTYTGPFTVSSTEYIAYDAIAPGHTHSADLEGIYTIGTAPTPQFSPAAGSYSTAQAVNIYDIAPGATIYYTTDGTTPTTASAVYTGPVIVTANQTIRAFAAASGLSSSAPISSAYTIGKGVATPAFSLAPGSYTSAQSVVITDITPGATIYYTTNGTAPTTASTRYTGPIAVSASETIEAIAVATGYTNSAIATAAYTIGYPIETFVATASGNGVVTVPVGGQSAFAVAASNGSGQSFPSIIVSTSTGSNTLLPVIVTLCQTNASTGQCLAAPAPTVALSSFAPGANASFSVFVTATAAIASNPANQIYVFFKIPGGTVVGSASVLVDTN